MQYHVKTMYAELRRLKQIYESDKYSTVDFEAYLDERINYFGAEAKAYDETFNFEKQTKGE